MDIIYTQFACVYHNNREYWSEWFDFSKKHKLRSVALNRPSDLPTPMKDHKMGLLNPYLFCIVCNDGTDDWEEIMLDTKNFKFQVLYNATNLEISIMLEFFDQRVKTKFGKNAKVWFKKNPNAPMLPSAAAEAEEASTNLSSAVQEASKWENQVLKPHLEAAFDYLFKKLKPNLEITMKKVLDLSDEYDMWFRLRDREWVTTTRHLMFDVVREYQDYCNNQIRSTALKCLNFIEEETEIFAQTNPLYKKYYYEGKGRFKDVDYFCNKTFKEGFEQYTKKIGVRLIYHWISDLFNDYGLSEYYRDIVFPLLPLQQDAKKPRVVQPYKPK